MVEAKTIHDYEWRGEFLPPERIAQEIFEKVCAAEPSFGRSALDLWLDDSSWNGLPRTKAEAESGVGCLHFAGMQIRNYYGLWKPECPYTQVDASGYITENNIITDPKFPDNLSAVIIDMAKKKLREHKEQQDAVHSGSESSST